MTVKPKVMTKHARRAILLLALTVSACSSEKSVELDESMDSQSSNTPALLAATQSPTQEPEPNLNPEILSISLGCDLITEVVSIKVGETADFFVLVNDELPNELTYSAATTDTSTVLASVDQNGAVLMNGLKVGTTELTLDVIDNAGQRDSIIVGVLVE